MTFHCFNFCYPIQHLFAAMSLLIVVNYYCFNLIVTFITRVTFAGHQCWLWFKGYKFIHCFLWYVFQHQPSSFTHNSHFLLTHAQFYHHHLRHQSSMLLFFLLLLLSKLFSPYYYYYYYYYYCCCCCCCCYLFSYHLLWLYIFIVVNLFLLS